MLTGVQNVEGVNLQDWESVAGLFHRAAETLATSPLRHGCSVRIPQQQGGRLLATGDLHDNPDHLRKIIALARLDESPNHHAVLHELIHGERLINGMDFSYRTLARVAELVVRYPSQVHPLLANHELSQLTGKGVSKGAGNSVELFNDALEYVFSDEWMRVSEAIGAFIRAMPLAACGFAQASDDDAARGSDVTPARSRERPPEHGLFCAHSLPDERAMRYFDADILDRNLTDDDFAALTGSAYAMVWGRRYSQEQIESLAEKWGVRLFVLGHRHVESGVETFGPRVIVLNSDHEHATVLPIDLANIPTAEEAMEMAVPLMGVD